MEYVLKYLEIAIIESCNLNCKGCSHFSPLAGSKDKESYTQSFAGGKRR